MKDTEKSEEELKQEIIENLRSEYKIEDEVSFNEFNINDKLKNHAFVFLKYQSQLDKVKYELEKLNELRDKIVGERYHYYRFNNDESLTKIEIEKYYLSKDEKVLKINKLIRLHQIKVDFFTICCKALDKMGWNMKNFIEAHRSI